MYVYFFLPFNILQCSAADPTSLLLLSDLAERSPLTLWSSSGTNGEALAGLFQGVLQSLSANSATNNSSDQVEASLEAVVRVAIASDEAAAAAASGEGGGCLLYTSPSPRDKRQSRMPSSA